MRYTIVNGKICLFFSFLDNVGDRSWIGIDFDERDCGIRIRV